MNKLSPQKKRVIYRLLAVIFSGAALFGIWHYNIDNKPEPVVKQNTKEIEPVKSEASEIPSEPTSVYVLGDIPFINNSYANYKAINIQDLEEIPEKSIILSSRTFLQPKNKSILNKVIDAGHSVLFYDKEINIEEIVLFFDGKVPVVPIESTQPLIYQGYGVTTLDNGNMIPLFVSASKGNPINAKAFEQLFLKIKKAQ